MQVDDFRIEQDKQIEVVDPGHYIHHFDSNWRSKRDEENKSCEKRTKKQLSARDKEWLVRKEKMINEMAAELCIKKVMKPKELYNKMIKSDRLLNGEKNVHYIYFTQKLFPDARERAGLEPLDIVVESMLKDGIKYQNIGDKLGVSRQYISAIARRNKIKNKFDTAKDMLKSSMTIKEIVEAGISDLVAYRAAKDLREDESNGYK